MNPAIKVKLLIQAKQYSYLHLDNILMVENAFIAGGEFAFSAFLFSDFQIPASNYASTLPLDTRDEHLTIINAFKAGAEFIIKNN